MVLTSARADAGTVVYGNLGISGTNGTGTNDPFGASSTDIGAGSTFATIGQGFTTGTSLLSIESATLGLFVTSGSPEARTVSIWSSSGGLPNTILFTSAPTNVGNTALYSFAFTGATLSPTTSYWLVPDTTGTTGMSWYWSDNNQTTSPTAQNSSGYAFLATRRTTGNGTWNNTILTGYSLSLTASNPGVVPEIDPNAIGGAMAFVTGALGWLERRRLARR